VIRLLSSIKLTLLAIACMLFASINRSALHIGSFACFVQFSKVYIAAFSNVSATLISYQLTF
ncbi:hypothetical protein, partial [Enterococcus canintestini]|uniref:hypothetical protein n=1 Tax=Enterococcus canintestini TaxID=317010 RepID=UPI0035EC7192